VEDNLVDDYGHRLNTNDVDKMRVVFAKLYYYLSRPFLDSSFAPEGRPLLKESLEEYAAMRNSIINNKLDDSSDHSKLLKLIFEDLSNYFSAQTHSNNQATIKVTKSPVIRTWVNLSSDPKAATLVDSYLQEVQSTLLEDNIQDLDRSKPAVFRPSNMDFDEVTFEIQGVSGFSSKHRPKDINEEDVPNLFRRNSDYWAYLYYFLAKKLLSLGQAGEAALRRAIREFGSHRGKELRRKVLANGQETTIKSLFENYDLPEDPRFEQDLIRQDEEVRVSKETKCNFSEVWSELDGGWEIGKIYCEEVHHAFYSAFEPAIQVNITQTLTRGDDYCDFVLFMRKANKFKDEKGW